MLAVDPGVPETPPVMSAAVRRADNIGLARLKELLEAGQADAWTAEGCTTGSECASPVDL